MRISDWSSDVCSSVLDEQQQGYDHARPDHCALYPGIALRFLVVVHFHSLYRRSQDRSARANNNICSAVRESLSKFAAEGPPVSPSRSHRPAITARPLYISYQAQVERELDQAHLHAASALAQVAISCAAAARSEEHTSELQSL